ncbi:hypothetical protein PAPYR_9412 [Paratrimastix pyriformis]|uniref:Uncharacterized protein n=1 Tax=Paratrimastix pyriformis TaxID=342808 RepID=A0ABQ8U8H8_9EUKA|nr:hypothetical protein PAPYR_9412 [Paratrimastix pyriformis]
MRERRPKLREGQNCGREPECKHFGFHRAGRGVTKETGGMCLTGGYSDYFALDDLDPAPLSEADFLEQHERYLREVARIAAVYVDPFLGKKVDISANYILPPVVAAGDSQADQGAGWARENFAAHPQHWRSYSVQSLLDLFERRDRLLTLSGLSSSVPGEDERAPDPATTDPVDPPFARQRLAMRGRAVLCGPRGAGKSLLLQRLMGLVAEQAIAWHGAHGWDAAPSPADASVPILMSLQEISPAVRTGNVISVAQYLKRTLGAESKRYKYLVQMLRLGRCFVMVDWWTGILRTTAGSPAARDIRRKQTRHSLSLPLILHMFGRFGARGLGWRRACIQVLQHPTLRAQPHVLIGFRSDDLMALLHPPPAAEEAEALLPPLDPPPVLSPSAASPPLPQPGLWGHFRAVLCTFGLLLMRPFGPAAIEAAAAKRLRLVTPPLAPCCVAAYARLLATQPTFASLGQTGAGLGALLAALQATAPLLGPCPSVGHPNCGSASAFMAAIREPPSLAAGGTLGGGSAASKPPGGGSWTGSMNGLDSIPSLTLTAAPQGLNAPQPLRYCGHEADSTASVVLALATELLNPRPTPTWASPSPPSPPVRALPDPYTRRHAGTDTRGIPLLNGGGAVRHSCCLINLSALTELSSGPAAPPQPPTPGDPPAVGTPPPRPTGRSSLDRRSVTPPPPAGPPVAKSAPTQPVAHDAVDGEWRLVDPVATSGPDLPRSRPEALVVLHRRYTTELIARPAGSVRLLAALAHRIHHARRMEITPGDVHAAVCGSSQGALQQWRRLCAETEGPISILCPLRYTQWVDGRPGPAPDPQQPTGGAPLPLSPETLGLQTPEAPQPPSPALSGSSASAPLPVPSPPSSDADPSQQQQQGAARSTPSPLTRPGSPMASSFAGALGWAADEPTLAASPGVAFTATHTHRPFHTPPPLTAASAHAAEAPEPTECTYRFQSHGLQEYLCALGILQHIQGVLAGATKVTRKGETVPPSSRVIDRALDDVLIPTPLDRLFDRWFAPVYRYCINELPPACLERFCHALLAKCDTHPGMLGFVLDALRSRGAAPEEVALLRESVAEQFRLGTVAEALVHPSPLYRHRVLCEVHQFVLGGEYLWPPVARLSPMLADHLMRRKIAFPTRLAALDSVAWVDRCTPEVMRVLLEKALHDPLLRPFTCSSLARLASQPHRPAGSPAGCKGPAPSSRAPYLNVPDLIPHGHRSPPATLAPPSPRGDTESLLGAPLTPRTVCETGERTPPRSESGQGTPRTEAPEDALGRSTDEAVSPLLLAAQGGAGRPSDGPVAIPIPGAPSSLREAVPLAGGLSPPLVEPSSALTSALTSVLEGRSFATMTLEEAEGAHDETEAAAPPPPAAASESIPEEDPGTDPDHDQAGRTPPSGQPLVRPWVHPAAPKPPSLCPPAPCPWSAPGTSLSHGARLSFPQPSDTTPPPPPTLSQLHTSPSTSFCRAPEAAVTADDRRLLDGLLAPRPPTAAKKPTGGAGEGAPKKEKGLPAHCHVPSPSTVPVRVTPEDPHTRIVSAMLLSLGSLLASPASIPAPPPLPALTKGPLPPYPPPRYLPEGNCTPSTLDPRVVVAAFGHAVGDASYTALTIAALSCCPVGEFPSNLRSAEPAEPPRLAAPIGGGAPPAPVSPVSPTIQGDLIVALTRGLVHATPAVQLAACRTVSLLAPALRPHHSRSPMQSPAHVELCAQLAQLAVPPVATSYATPITPPQGLPVVLGTALQPLSPPRTRDRAASISGGPSPPPGGAPPPLPPSRALPHHHEVSREALTAMCALALAWGCPVPIPTLRHLAGSPIGHHSSARLPRGAAGGIPPDQSPAIPATSGTRTRSQSIALAAPPAPLMLPPRAPRSPVSSSRTPPAAPSGLSLSITLPHRDPTASRGPAPSPSSSPPQQQHHHRCICTLAAAEEGVPGFDGRLRVNPAHYIPLPWHTESQRQALQQAADARAAPGSPPTNGGGGSSSNGSCDTLGSGHNRRTVVPTGTLPLCPCLAASLAQVRAGKADNVAMLGRATAACAVQWLLDTTADETLHRACASALHQLGFDTVLLCLARSLCHRLASMRRTMAPEAVPQARLCLRLLAECAVWDAWVLDTLTFFVTGLSPSAAPPPPGSPCVLCILEPPYEAQASARLPLGLLPTIPASLASGSGVPDPLLASDPLGMTDLAENQTGPVLEVLSTAASPTLGSPLLGSLCPTLFPTMADPPPGIGPSGERRCCKALSVPPMTSISETIQVEALHTLHVLSTRAPANAYTHMRVNGILGPALAHPSPAVRFAALRVAERCSRLLPHVLEQIRECAQDQVDANVRTEAIRVLCAVALRSSMAHRAKVVGFFVEQLEQWMASFARTKVHEANDLRGVIDQQLYQTLVVSAERSFSYRVRCALARGLSLLCGPVPLPDPAAPRVDEPAEGPAARPSDEQPAEASAGGDQEPDDEEEMPLVVGGRRYRLPPLPTRVVNVLVALFNDDEKTHLAAIEALGLLAQRPNNLQDLSQLLLPGLESTHLSVRIVTARALAAVHQRDATALVYFLCKALKQSDDTEFARVCVHSIAQVGVATEQQACLLIELFPRHAAALVEPLARYIAVSPLRDPNWVFPASVHSALLPHAGGCPEAAALLAMARQTGHFASLDTRRPKEKLDTKLVFLPVRLMISH